MKQIALAAALLLGASQMTHAELRVGQYQQMKDSQRADLYALIGGLGEGIAWANAWIESHNQPKLYCPPNIPLQTQNYKDILDAEITSAPPGLITPDLPIGMVIMLGLEKTFPCKK